MVSKEARVKTWISKAGNLNNKIKLIKGFTIIELVIVISIMGIVLFFMIPEFKAFQLFSNSSNSLGRTIGLISDLKRKALSENMDLVMNIDPGSGLIWVTDDSMEEEQILAAKKKGIKFSSGMTIVDVEFGKKHFQQSSAYQIRFNRHGYSDMAMIHIKKDENDVTIRIEPFLSGPEVENRYVSFDECI